MQHAQTDQIVEGLDQIDRTGGILVRPRLLDIQGVAARIGKGVDVEQRLTTPGLHIQQVAEHVIFLERRIGSYRLFALGIMVEAQVVERVLVGFQTDVFEAVGYAGMAGRGFAVFPAFGIDHLGDAGFKYGVKVVTHFEEDVFSLAVIRSVEVDHRMASGTGTSEKI